MELDFKNKIYPDILNALKNDTTYYTKTKNEPNHVLIENNDILVMTNEVSLITSIFHMNFS